ncbi:MAG: GTPase ObgE, partial [Bacteroidia bacterium]|nr:GTPase ObgE [Bacteroidia bacterium]
KSDMLDAELEKAIRNEFPKDVELLFFSAVAQKGITELKDVLWNAINEPV